MPYSLLITSYTFFGRNDRKQALTLYQCAAEVAFRCASSHYGSVYITLQYFSAYGKETDPLQRDMLKRDAEVYVTQAEKLSLPARATKAALPSPSPSPSPAAVMIPVGSGSFLSATVCMMDELTFKSSDGSSIPFLQMPLQALPSAKLPPDGGSWLKPARSTSVST